MKKITADTNSFLRFLLNDIPEQKQAFETIVKQAKLKRISLIVPQIVIFEIEFTLEKFYKFPKEERVEKLESIINMKYFNIQNRILFIKALELFKKKNLDLADCFIFAYSQNKNSDLFTFDKALKRLK